MNGENDKNKDTGGVTLPEVKTGEAILKESGLMEGKPTLTGIQRAGMRILLFVGIVSSVVILGLGLEYVFKSPKTPAVDAPLELIKNYKEVSGMVLSNTKDLFDMIVMKVLYPLATLVLGYVFGKRTAEETTQE